MTAGGWTMLDLDYLTLGGWEACIEAVCNEDINYRHWYGTRVIKRISLLNLKFQQS